MHPGPMNRGVEIASEIADGPQSVIEEQVEMGVAVRMAVMEALIGGAEERSCMSATSSVPLVIENARIVDPSAFDRRDRQRGRRGRAGSPPPGRTRSVRDDRTAPRSSTARGLTLFPGLVDARVFIGEPGVETPRDDRLGLRGRRGRRRHLDPDDAGHPPGRSTTWPSPNSSCAPPARPRRSTSIPRPRSPRVSPAAR